MLLPLTFHTLFLAFFFLMLPRPPTSTLFPYTTLFRSLAQGRSFLWFHRPEVRLIVAAPGDIRLTLTARNPERSEEHTSELQSRFDLVCRLLLEKKKSASCLV